MSSNGEARNAGTGVEIRLASATDLIDIETMLVAASLPVEGVADHVTTFRVATRGGRVIGSAGVELYGDAGLLRSVVVRPDAQGQGVGAALTHEIVADVKRANVRELFLLTTTAPAYFQRLGFEQVSRQSVPSTLQASAELQGACPATAIVMRLDLKPRV